MKKALLVLVIVAAVGGSVYAYYSYRKGGVKPNVTAAPVTRGDVVETVGATGTLQAVTTVQVGTQVSGTIQSLYADFNSLVKKGQVLARLDPSLFQTQIEQARANLIRSQAEVDRLKVSLDDARTKLRRAQELSQRNLIPRTDLETAEVNVRSVEAQIHSAEAQVTQAQASVNQNDVNLQHTVIESPIDGLVISRNVDVGQTVAASMQAPTLFVLAADLTKMQVLANLDESDVGRIRPGQQVSFRVDAYPTDTFHGAVSQVRLNPIVQQNVVTYATVIDVPNNDLRLKPGMTANVNVEIARATNVLRVPNAALRFRPTPEMFTALGLAPPPQNQRGDVAGRRGGTGQSPQQPGTAAPSATASSSSSSSAASTSAAPPSAPPLPALPAGNGNGNGEGSGGPGARGGAGGAGDGRERFAERLQQMTPEQREQALQRMRERGLDPASGGGGRGAPASGSSAAGAAGANTGASARGNSGARANGRGAAPPLAARAQGATTIDALFGPLQKVETGGRAWQYVDKQLKQIRLRLGISDGQTTEVIEGDVQEGTALVTNISTATESTRPAPTAFPFGPQPGRGGFPGGGFGGGGRGAAGGAGGRGR
jgi:HlyD family secretion protein